MPVFIVMPVLMVTLTYWMVGQYFDIIIGLPKYRRSQQINCKSTVDPRNYLR